MRTLAGGRRAVRRLLAALTASVALLPVPAAAQRIGEELHGDHWDRVRFQGVRREATPEGERLVLSLDILTFRDDRANRIHVAQQSDRDGRDVVPVQGQGRFADSSWTRRDYVLNPTPAFPHVRIWQRDGSSAGSLRIKSWSYDELARLAPPLPDPTVALVGTTRIAQAGGSGIRLKLRLGNPGGPAGIPVYVMRASRSGGGYDLARVSGPTSLAVGATADFEYALTPDPAYPLVQVVRTATNKRLAEYEVADLESAALDPFVPGDLAALAGRYRTSVGTMMTFVYADGGLRGNSQTVGAKADLAETVELRMDEGKLAGELHGYTGGRKVPIGPIRFDPGQRQPFVGRFADGRRAHAYTACPVAEDEIADWRDPRIRIGFGLWARLDEVRVSLSSSRQSRVVEAKLTVWSVSSGGSVLVWAGTGGEGRTMMGRTTGFGGEPGALPQLQPCQQTSMVFRTSGIDESYDSLMLEGTINGARFALPWDIRAELAKVSVPPASPLPDTAPAQSPPSPPPPAPIPAAPPASPGSPLGNTGPSRPTTGGTAVAGSVPVGTETYSNYGIWDFRIEELKPGPDGHWQAVLWVRDAASYPVGMAPGQVTLVLIDEDGRTLRSDPLLYRASVPGPITGLQVIPQTLWMEKGDEIRLRVVFDNSAGFQPVRFRIAGGGHDPLSRTFDFR